MAFKNISSSPPILEASSFVLISPKSKDKFLRPSESASKEVVRRMSISASLLILSSSTSELVRNFSGDLSPTELVVEIGVDPFSNRNADGTNLVNIMENIFVHTNSSFVQLRTTKDYE